MGDEAKQSEPTAEGEGSTQRRATPFIASLQLPVPVGVGEGLDVGVLEAVELRLRLHVPPRDTLTMAAKKTGQCNAFWEASTPHSGRNPSSHAAISRLSDVLNANGTKHVINRCKTCLCLM